MIAYCKMELLKLKHNSNHFALKSRLYTKAVKAAFEELQRLKIHMAKLEASMQLPKPLLA